MLDLFSTELLSTINQYKPIIIYWPWRFRNNVGVIHADFISLRFVDRMNYLLGVGKNQKEVIRENEL
jgi:hypothetical protein